jgi:hypothetical protein
MNRSTGTAIAQQTIEITKQRHYRLADGRTVEIAPLVESCWAGILVRKGSCSTPDEALTIIRSVRPLAKLNPAQGQFLRRICEHGKPTSPERFASGKGA